MEDFGVTMASTFVAESAGLVRTLSRSSLFDEVTSTSCQSVRIPSSKRFQWDVVSRRSSSRVPAVRTAVEEGVPLFMLEDAFEKDPTQEYVSEGGGGQEPQESKSKESTKRKGESKSGASTVLSGVKLENVSKTYKDATVLKDVSWEVKKGERVGLVGINGAGKTTQLNIIAGKEEAYSGNVVKARGNMKIAFLSQEFEVVGSRTLREEFMSTFGSEMDIAARMEKVQVCGLISSSVLISSTGFNF